MSRNDKCWAESKPKFVNPYNFVGLGGEVKRSNSEKGVLTGKISCTLTVKTPLCIPDAETKRPDPTPENKQHFQYDFYRVNGVPVITGSQLKGMVRTYYEAISNSCLSVNNNNIMSARHSFSRCPGLIKHDKNGWHLYPASKKPVKERDLNKDEYKRVWYDSTGKETNTFAFTVSGEEIECSNLEDAVRDYNENINIYKSNDTARKFINKYGSKLTYQLRRDTLNPVFYEMLSDDSGNTLVYLSPSQLGRTVFTKKIDDILGSHRSCSKTNGACLCKACSLFGMISEKNGGASKASCLRFSDAKAISGTFSSDRNVTLKELASPKTTSVEFYTLRPKEALAWTYESKTIDYIKTRHGSKINLLPKRLLCDVELNGRKFYIHNPELRKDDYHTPYKTKRNNSMELCREGTQFSFDVYFENISETQLKELVWVLALGENSTDSNRMFKLGHGKPLGLGSVKITVNDIESREFDREQLTYSVKKVAPSEFLSDVPFDTESNLYKEFIAIIDFRTAEEALKSGAKISYPIADDGKNKINSKASHQWFIANRSSGEGGTETAWSIKYSLPRITSKNLTLPSFVAVKGGEGKKQYREKSKYNNRTSLVYRSDSNENSGFCGRIRIKNNKNNKKK